jgi:hypothetical protein
MTIRNSVLRLFWSCIPLGVAVWYFSRYGKGDDTLNGFSGWSRAWSSYGEKKGAVVLIRKVANK